MIFVNWILKYITQRVFRENQWNKFGVEDPYYEEYETVQRSFFSGTPTVKKVKKPRSIPTGLSVTDSTTLRKVMRRAYHLDMLFSIFGYRIGWSGIVGILPVVGDIAGVVFSLLLFKTAREVEGGLPLPIQLKFIGNILIDFLIGLIPIVGNVVEVIYKANSRNALLLEKHLEEKAQLNSRKQEFLLSSQSPNIENGSSSFESSSTDPLLRRREL